jgi:hypothetical protein
LLIAEGLVSCQQKIEAVLFGHPDQGAGCPRSGFSDLGCDQLKIGFSNPAVRPRF